MRRLRRGLTKPLYFLDNLSMTSLMVTPLGLTTLNSTPAVVSDSWTQNSNDLIGGSVRNFLVASLSFPFVVGSEIFHAMLAISSWANLTDSGSVCVCRKGELVSH